MERVVFTTDASISGVADDRVAHCMSHVCDEVSSLIDELHVVTEIVYGDMDPKMKHYQGDHDQEDHGNWSDGGDVAVLEKPLGTDEDRDVDELIAALERKRGAQSEIEKDPEPEKPKKTEGGKKGPVDYSKHYPDVEPVSITKLNSWASMREGTLRAMGIPQDTTDEDLAKLAGFNDSAKIKIFAHGKPSRIYLEAEDGFINSRQLKRDENGDLVLYNSIFAVKKSTEKGKGMGTEVFARQVQAAAKLGVSRVETRAVRSDTDPEYPDDASKEAPGKGANGYYTWPRFGYDSHIDLQDLAGMEETVHRGLKKHPEFKSVSKLSDLMKTKEGREFWRQYGCDVSLEFDLTPGSHSLEIFGAYLEAKHSKAKT